MFGQQSEIKALQMQNSAKKKDPSQTQPKRKKTVVQFSSTRVQTIINCLDEASEQTREREKSRAISAEALARRMTL
jgi:hypothetical protein